MLKHDKGHSLGELLDFSMWKLRDVRKRYGVYRDIRRRFPTAHIDPNTCVWGDLRNLELGRDVIIQFGSFLHLGGMAWCQQKGKLTIGDGSVISPNCVIYGCGPGGVSIGKNFDCGPGVCIFASRTDYERSTAHHIFAPVVIGNNVTVFANTVISPGVRVGEGSVIAACSVVTSDVPAHCLVGGAPAKVLRTSIRSPQGREVTPKAQVQDASLYDSNVLTHSKAAPFR
jgi:acetyltransferase-like isoleucine patch superfamily enzyme